MNPKRTIKLIAWCLFFLSGCNDLSKQKNTSFTNKINDIDDFDECKNKFGILRINKLGKSSSCRLGFYRKCGINYQKDSVVDIQNYVFLFQNNSNTQIEVLSCVSGEYADLVFKELQPFVTRVRSFEGKTKQNKDFCVKYYLSRIYNAAVLKNKIYLFGYDAHNVTSETITVDNLKSLDLVCNALK